jgi:hypothetical protein
MKAAGSTPSSNSDSAKSPCSTRCACLAKVSQVRLGGAQQSQWLPPMLSCSTPQAIALHMMASASVVRTHGA